MDSALYLASWLPTLRDFLEVVLVIASLFIILLVIVQREKGGGLAGAFGGMGGSSTFGVKTADVLTLITRWSVALFFLLAIAIGMINVQITKDGVQDTPAKTKEKDQ